MNSDIFEQLKNLSKKNFHDPLWLDKQEQVLRAHIRVRPSMESRPYSQTVMGGLNTVAIFRQLLRPMTAFISLVVVVVASLSVVANDSMPGNALYGWKTEVNERVESALTVGSENQADLEVKLLGRRMNEQAKVNADANASAEVKAEARADVEKQEREAREAVAKVEEKDTKAEFKAKVEAKIAESKEAIARAEKTLAETKAEGTLVINARARLQLAKDTLAEAQADLSAEAYGNAYAKAVRAGNYAAQAEVWVSVEVKLDTRIEL